jgi:hypothetical protein
LCITHSKASYLLQQAILLFIPLVIERPPGEYLTAHRLTNSVPHILHRLIEA